jgi:Tol biopolymer transport system component
MSADGRYVAFTSLASNLVANDTNNDFDVFIRDRHAGTTKRVSLSSMEGQSSLGSYASSISGDGRYVTFSSYSSDLVGDDTNHTSDVFVRDRLNGTTKRISISTARLQGNGFSYASSISADGRYIVFQSEASNLVAADTNGKSDIFVRGPLH